MGWTATILVPHVVPLACRTQEEADVVAKQITSQYEKVGEVSAKLLRVDPTPPKKWIPDDLPPPAVAA